MNPTQMIHYFLNPARADAVYNEEHVPSDFPTFGKGAIKLDPILLHVCNYNVTDTLILTDILVWYGINANGERYKGGLRRKQEDWILREDTEFEKYGISTYKAQRSRKRLKQLGIMETLRMQSPYHRRIDEGRKKVTGYRIIEDVFMVKVLEANKALQNDAKAKKIFSQNLGSSTSDKTSSPQEPNICSSSEDKVSPATCEQNVHNSNLTHIQLDNSDSSTSPQAKPTHKNPDPELKNNSSGEASETAESPESGEVATSDEKPEEPKSKKTKNKKEKEPSEQELALAELMKEAEDESPETMTLLKSPRLTQMKQYMCEVGAVKRYRGDTFDPITFVRKNPVEDTPYETLQLHEQYARFIHLVLHTNWVDEEIARMRSKSRLAGCEGYADVAISKFLYKAVATAIVCDIRISCTRSFSDHSKHYTTITEELLRRKMSFKDFKLWAQARKHVAIKWKEDPKKRDGLQAEELARDILLGIGLTERPDDTFVIDATHYQALNQAFSELHAKQQAENRELITEADAAGVDAQLFHEMRRRVTEGLSFAEMEPLWQMMKDAPAIYCAPSDLAVDDFPENLWDQANRMFCDENRRRGFLDMTEATIIMSNTNVAWCRRMDKDGVPTLSLQILLQNQYAVNALNREGVQAVMEKILADVFKMDVMVSYVEIYGWMDYMNNYFTDRKLKEGESVVNGQKWEAWRNFANS